MAVRGVYRRSDTGKWVASVGDTIARQLGIKPTAQFDTRPEAEQWRKNQEARAQLGQGADHSDGTVSEHMGVWLAGLRNKATTRANKENLIKRFVTDRPFGNMQTAAVRGMHIDELLLSAPENNTRLHLSTLLSVFFRWAYNNEITRANPYPRSQYEGIRADTRATVSTERRETTDARWTLDQLYWFLDEEDDPVYLLLWELYASTGGRRGEGIGARWTFTDLERMSVRLEDNITVAGGTVLNTYSPKNRVRRTSYFGPYLAGRLADWRAEQDDYRAGCRVWATYTDRHGRTHPADWVFDRRVCQSPNPVPPGSHLNPGTVHERFKRNTRRAGLPELSGPHGMRRTFGTLVDSARIAEPGRERAVLVGVLGHAPDVTEGYVRATESELRAAALHIDGLLAARRD